MSGKAVSAVLNLQDVGPAKLVLVALANAYNDGTGRCCPDQERLAREAECQIKTVQRHLKTLEDRGLITRSTQVIGFGAGKKTFYKLPFLSGGKAQKIDQKSGGTPALKPSESRQVTPLNLGTYTPHFTSDQVRKLRGVYKAKPEIDQKRRVGECARDRVQMWAQDAAFAAADRSVIFAAEVIAEIAEAVLEHIEGMQAYQLRDLFLICENATRIDPITRTILVADPKAVDLATKGLRHALSRCRSHVSLERAAPGGSADRQGVGYA